MLNIKILFVCSLFLSNMCSGSEISESRNYDSFERVIGLGNCCLTKALINAYFCPDVPMGKTKKGHSDLFDWTLIADYTLLSEALSNKLEHICSIENWHMKTNAVNGLHDDKYKIGWPHIFESNLYPCISDSELFTTEERDWDKIFCDYYEKIEEKIHHLKRKFIDAKHKKTIYILSSNGINIETLLTIRDSLIDVRDGDTSFLLLYVTAQKNFDDMENILVREDRTNPTFNGEIPYRWCEILNEFKFVDDIWE